MRKSNIFKKFTVLALTFAIGVGCISCKKDEEEVATKPQDETGIHQGEVSVDESRTLFSGGTSNYQIVLPDKPTTQEASAASELEHFFRMSTSYSLPIVNESSFKGTQYFSVGQTELLDESGIDYDEDELGVSGFKTVTDDSNVYFIGATGGYGSLFAVYNFLEYAVGYEYYAADEYWVDTLTSVPFYNMDVTEVPTIQRRQIDTYVMGQDSDNARRLRLTGMSNNSAYTGVHTELQIMPYDKYREHSDWYSNGGLHLCYSADGLMDEFVKNIQAKLVEEPTADLVNLGLSDNNSFCGCDKCSAKISKYGTESAVMLLFMNDVVARINEWLEINYPDRYVQFLLLAYQKTVDAPVSKNEDGAWEPNATELICEDNLGIYIADAGVDYSQRLDSTRNQPRLDIVQKWAALSNKIYIYTYATNFSYLFCSFPNYLAFQDNYAIWANSNVECVDETGNHNCQSVTFDALRNYLMSNFMWNSKLNYNATVKKFMTAYYKEAGDAMYEYFTALSTWQKYLPEIESGDYGYLYYQYRSQHWPKYILDGFQAAIDKAYAAIEPLKTTEGAKYEKLFNRIKLEELSVTYMYLMWHQGYFKRVEKAAMIDDFERYCTKFGVTHEFETGSPTVFDTITAWRSAL